MGANAILLALFVGLASAIATLIVDGSFIASVVMYLCVGWAAILVIVVLLFTKRDGMRAFDGVKGPKTENGYRNPRRRQDCK